MFMKQIILLATVFAAICATKEQSQNSGYAQPGEHTIHNQHTIYGQPMQDNLASETEIAKRASASLSTTSGSSNSESQGQTSQIDVGSGAAGNGVISYGTPNSYQQFYSPSFGQFGGALFAATAAPGTSSSTSGATPQVFYVRAPAQYVAPSGIGTIKLTYTGESSQPTTSIQYAAAAPKFAYNLPSNPYQVAYATQPNPYTYAPLSLASPYTTSGYASPNVYGNGPFTAASLQQGQIIPYTAAANGFYLSPTSLQQLGFSLPQSLSTSATVQPLTAYTTATPIVPNVSKIGSNVVTPTASAYYAAAPASQTYQQSPTFLSYANAATASPLNYATGKFYAVPSYTQAFRSVVAPTISTTSPYTYVQPTGSSPIKYSLTQPLTNNYASSSTPYNHKLYAPSITATTSPYTSAVHQSLNQAIAAQASNTNNAIQYATQQLYPSQQLTANKYGYSQLAATPQKYFYASS